MSNTLTGILEWPLHQLAAHRAHSPSGGFDHYRSPMTLRFPEWGDQFPSARVCRSRLKWELHGRRTSFSRFQARPRCPSRLGAKAPSPAGCLASKEDAQAFTARKQTPFEELTVVDPCRGWSWSTPAVPLRADWLISSPHRAWSKRGLIVSPPKVGKTTLLKDLALSILRNHRDIDLFMLLVDERPEEVTDFSRTIAKASEEFPGGTAASSPRPRDCQQQRSRRGAAHHRQHAHHRAAAAAWSSRGGMWWCCWIRSHASAAPSTPAISTPPAAAP